MGSRSTRGSEPTEQRRSATDAAARSPRPAPGPGGINAFDSLFVSYAIRDGATEQVRGLLAEWASERPDADSRALLPVDGVDLVTLFLDEGSTRSGRPDDETDDLLWYLEVGDDDVDAWDDPDLTIRTASPLFEAGLDDLLAGPASVRADGVGGRQLVTHATHPRRRRRYEDGCERSLYAPVAGDDLPIEVAVKTVRLKPGVTSWLVSGAVALGNWIKRSDRVSEWIRGQTDTLVEEAMYTESLLLEPAEDRRLLRYYMETESMERLYDAYESTDNPEARASDWAMRRIFEAPEEITEYPLETDCEVLVHAVHPERP